MLNPLLYENFAKFLHDQFEDRRNRNYRYSLRSYARDVGISPSRLSEIMNGSAISVSSAQKICTRLEIGEEATDHLLDLVRLKSAAGKRKDSTPIEKRISERQAHLGFKTEFSSDLLSRWYLIAVMEFLTNDNPIPVTEIAKRLGLNSVEVLEAQEILLQSGYLQKTGDEFSKSEKFLKIENRSSVDAIQNYHRSYLNQAAAAVAKQAIDKRHFQTFVLTLRPEDMEAAKGEIDRFCADFASRYSEKSGQSTDLHALGVQLFRIDQFKTRS